MIGGKLSTIVKALPHFAETMGRYFLRVIPQKVTRLWFKGTGINLKLSVDFVNAIGIVHMLLVLKAKIED